MPNWPQVDLQRQSVTADSWGRYYTSSLISSTLVCAMSKIRPRLVIELGAGRGALASAAALKWSRARYVTVDTDNSSKTVVNGLKSQTKHIHHVHDALDSALAERIGLEAGSVDIGLCNPPYVRPRWKTSFGHILEDAGLSGALRSVHDAGADILFIAQNLRLLKRRGKLGLIIPDGLITAEKYRGVRSILLRDHLVEQVVQLPRQAFSQTEAQTYLLVLSKHGGHTQSVALRQMNTDGTLSAPINVPADQAQYRLDYNFHAVTQNHYLNATSSKLRVPVSEVVHTIFRGSLNSKQLSTFSRPVFHLGDFAQCPQEIVPIVPARFIQPRPLAAHAYGSVRMAEAGDILIARIGRNLEKKVCLLERGSCVISGCIFVLRTERAHRHELLAYLLSAEGQQAVAAASHGVGAKYLSRADILHLSMPS
ncbi:hypothetical protein BH11PSE13_BH11PSE13_40550 [soil metagenome]